MDDLRRASDRSGRDERRDVTGGPAAARRTRFSTISDVEIAALYGPEDWLGPMAGGGGPTAVDHHGESLPRGAWDAFDPVRDIGQPGRPPFTRGVHPTGYRSRLWT